MLGERGTLFFSLVSPSLKHKHASPFHLFTPRLMYSLSHYPFFLNPKDTKQFLSHPPPAPKKNKLWLLSFSTPNFK